MDETAAMRETGHHCVCDTQEGGVRVQGRNADRKKRLLFSYFRKGNIIQKDRKRRLE